jgi:hypothetical protein
LRTSWQPVGEAVGYKVRFTDHTRPDAYIKLMTDGILLAETQGDRELAAYDTIIVDEAHERSLNIDFLLGYLKLLLQRRPDLRVIITSATLDANRFSRHFGTPEAPAPVIEVSGRTYPVDVRYRRCAMAWRSAALMGRARPTTKKSWRRRSSAPTCGAAVPATSWSFFPASGKSRDVRPAAAPRAGPTRASSRSCRCRAALGCRAATRVRTGSRPSHALATNVAEPR